MPVKTLIAEPVEAAELTETTNPGDSNDAKLANYQLLVNTKAATKSPDIVPNKGPLHAAIAMSKLFDETKSEVKMIVRSFSGPVCDQPNYLYSLRRCINDNIKFRIIHIDDLNQESYACQLLCLAQKGKKDIKFHKASKVFKDKLKINDTLVHFAVFDNDKFRYENDPTNFVAWFCFNDEISASTLSNLFDSGFK